MYKYVVPKARLRTVWPYGVDLCLAPDTNAKRFYSSRNASIQVPDDQNRMVLGCLLRSWGNQTRRHWLA